MWKPGTSKPINNSPSKIESSSSKSPKSGGSSSAKKLSNSTMGMRFMQRKNESNNKEQTERKAVLQAAAVRNRNQTTNDNSVPASNRNGKFDRKRENEEISKGEQSTSDGSIILELASVVDMYGVGSDIVGRRSFGGFRKTVRTTWEGAVKRQTDDDARTRNTKSHITDEELLERYEKYVKGRGGEKVGRKGKRG
ncbi:hypothetical protein ACHAXR_013138 [Thalassiosira sp. AJA248-18]